MEKKIQQLKNDLVEKIREYSLSQQQQWQRVPYLALMADGRSGFNGNYSRAYHQGYWALESSCKSGYYNVYVDLDNGNLVDAHHAASSIDLFDVDIPKESKSVPANEDEIITLDLDNLDARSLVRMLQQQAQEPYPSYYKAEEQEAWRRKTLQELDLKPIYTRR
ncbi:MAG: hypothetical protein Q8R37_02585 [Nanoarchaeota archaeon]|nr:hypothetical protein [Nanoarchaeota archaeon]